jgi:hypothetical protein
MSFQELKVAELKQIAEDFAVDVDGLKNKAEVIAALAEEGVTYEAYRKTLSDIEDAKEEVEVLPKPNAKSLKATEGNSLVRMTRDNYRYDVIGKTFTKDHPFVVMSEDDAQKIFDSQEGFRLATPKEVQEFYS